jgi:hypothetical protein
MGFPDSLGATEFVVKMCDGNSFKMELACATLTKAHDAVVLHYSITFGKGGGQLLPDRNTDVRSIISANVPLLGEDASCSEAFGAEFTFRLGDSMVGLALDKESRSVATIVRAKGGVCAYNPRSHLQTEKLYEFRRPLWDEAAHVDTTGDSQYIVRQRKTNRNQGDASRGRLAGLWILSSSAALL